MGAWVLIIINGGKDKKKTARIDRELTVFCGTLKGNFNKKRFQGRNITLDRAGITANRSGRASWDLEKKKIKKGGMVTGPALNAWRIFVPAIRDQPSKGTHEKSKMRYQSTPLLSPPVGLFT